MIRQAVLVDLNLGTVMLYAGEWAKSVGATVELQGAWNSERTIGIKVKRNNFKLQVVEPAADRYLNVVRENPAMGPAVPRSLQIAMPLLLHGGDIEQGVVQDLLKYLLKTLAGYWSAEDGTLWGEVFYRHDRNTGWKNTRLALESGPVSRMSWDALFDHLGSVVEIPDLDDYWNAVFRRRNREEASKVVDEVVDEYLAREREATEKTSAF